MYAYRYADGAEVMHNGQAETGGGSVLWEEMVWGNVPDGDLEENQLGRGSMQSSDYQLARYSTAGRSGVQLAGKRPQQQPRIADLLACVAAGCIAALGGCALSGPLYIECLILACAAVLAGCTIGWIIQNIF
ncbi:MAG TPA: hypothetical protein VGF69_19315 [Thermoanaerobaculia bacterium]|jgi:hypothetical protein